MGTHSEGDVNVAHVVQVGETDRRASTLPGSKDATHTPVAKCGENPHAERDQSGYGDRVKNSLERLPDEYGTDSDEADRVEEVRSSLETP